MKILLTGGAGFIGSALADTLLNLGHELVILDNLCDFYDPRLKQENLDWVRRSGAFVLKTGDIRDSNSLITLFREHRPERVIHLAAMAGVRPSLDDPGLYCDVNITGTVNLLAASCEFGVDQFIFGSSSSVYGANSKVPFQEEDPLSNMLSPYAATKLAGENLCSIYSRNNGLPTVCLRFFTVYGPRQRPEMAIHKFCRMIDTGQKIQVYHNGRSARDYTYIDDIIRGIIASLECKKEYEVYNLGNSNTVNLLDLVGMLENELGKKADMELMPQQIGDVPITFADISKAKSELDFSPQISLEEGITRFVTWFRTDRVRF